MSKTTLSGVSLAVMAAGLACAMPQRALALSMKECGANYEAAKKAGTLNGQDWKAYRAANCGAGATSSAGGTAPVAAAMPTPPQTSAATTAASAPPVAAAPVPRATAPAVAPAVANAASPVFPRAIDPKYASLKAGKGRMKTCDEQYQANKATGGNAGLKWIEKGDGYYSECSKHLKGI